jgi:acetoacetyl-CoA synthetase
MTVHVQNDRAETAIGDEAPKPPSVDQVIAIWSRVLNISPICRDSNFFDLGGDSFLAMTMLLEVERETGVNVPFTAIYDAPTAESLAAFLQKPTPEFCPLVCLKSGERAPAFFIVHGIGGTVMELVKLGALIDYQGPVYAIQAKGVDGSVQPLSNVQEIAKYYAAAVRRIQPDGPYLIAGYSFGGLVAIEMGRLLKQQGEVVGDLVLIDSYAHPRTWPWRSRLAVRWRRFKSRAGLIAKHPLREGMSYARLTVTQAKARSRRYGDRANSVVNWLGDQTCSLTPTLRLVHAAGEMALDSYAPRPYPGNILFLRAERSAPQFPTQPKRIWRRLVRTITVHTVKGDHYSVVGDHVSSIAARISLCLSDMLKALSVTTPLARDAGPDLGHRLGGDVS